MEFELHILGSASAKPGKDRNQSAQVLSVHGRSFLIDCGEGTQTQMRRFGISHMKIDSIFISHIHGDHVFGIFGLLSTMGMLGRSVPLNIYAPNSFGPILKFFLSYYGDGLNFEIRYVVVKASEPEIIYSTKSLEVLAFPLNHGIETYGYLFREKRPQYNVKKDSIEGYGLSLTEIGTLKRGEDVHRGDMVIPASEAAYMPYEPRSYAYCSDTAPFPELPQWVAGVDILYHEATYTEEFAAEAAKRHHSTAAQAAECALKAGAARLVLGHYSSRFKSVSAILKEAKAIYESTVAANDGDVFEVPLDKVRL